MKSSRNAKQAYVGIIRSGGRIVLPPKPATFKLGQRVYCHWNGREIVFSNTPKRASGGRLLSSQIRRGVRTLSSTGPARHFIAKVDLSQRFDDFAVSLRKRMPI
jgi:hypothetical protein